MGLTEASGFSPTDKRRIRRPKYPYCRYHWHCLRSTHSILNKGMVMPVLSNQKMTAYLKGIADVCGITKNITFHLARHTFATTVTLNNGVPLETVSKMLGYKSIKQTQHMLRL